MSFFKELVYLLCIITSLSCTVLLFRSYMKQRVRLLLWGTICFIGLTINNVILFMDIVILEQIDLRVPRLLSSLTGMLFLLYGFIWDSQE